MLSATRFWQRLTALVCVLALCIPVFSTALAVQYPYDTVSMDDVNLRRYASQTSVVLKKIAAGDTVTVLGVSGKYYKIKFDGVTGYAVKEYINGTSTDADAPVPANVYRETLTGITGYPYDSVTIARVKLRKTAKADGEVHKMLPQGTIVTVLSLTDNGFARVKSGGTTGYVVSTHINLAEIPQAEAKAEATIDPAVARYTELKSGDKGDAVKALQLALAELGYMEEKDADGKFGKNTASALKTFQKRNGFTQDSIATQKLQYTLYEGTPKDYKGYRQYVKTVAPIQNPLIRAGGKGDAVSKAQARLKELGYYGGNPTGTCDEITVAAIKLFEGRNNLNADGELSQADQELLYSASALTTSDTIPLAQTEAPFTKTLRRNDRGDEVKTLQTRLTDLGYYTGSISGSFTGATETAVKAFQQKNMLEVDGVVGAITRTVLFGVNAIPVNGEAQTVTVYETVTKENVVVIRSGSKGDSVLKLQQRLQELGYYLSRQDGIYLSDDITAVRAFQKANGLTVDGTAGYETQSVLYSANAVPAASTAAAGETEEEESETMRYGSSGNNVVTLQNRLIALGYLVGNADGKYGSATRTAVKHFQSANGLTADGIAGAKTTAKLYDTKVVDNKLNTKQTLRVGAVGDAVREMQNRLIALGYLKGKADGIFGNATRLALISFQQQNRLTADGVAGSKTLTKLNATNVTAASGSTAAATAVPQAISAAGVNAAQVRYENWYDTIRAKCRTYPNATVYDFSTGISWQVNMFSLGKHADCEPLTAADTEAMNRAFGGKTTWTPKAVWVILSDGTVYMASTHNTPHGTSHINSNNFNGHMCIHFPRTQAQVDAIGPYATSHQETIDAGWLKTQQMR